MDILQHTFLGNSLEHWLIALAWAVGGIIVARILYKVVGSIARKITSKTRSNLDDLIVDKLRSHWFCSDHRRPADGLRPTQLW